MRSADSEHDPSSRLGNQITERADHACRPLAWTGKPRSVDRSPASATWFDGAVPANTSSMPTGIFRLISTRVIHQRGETPRKSDGPGNFPRRYQVRNGLRPENLSASVIFCWECLGSFTTENENSSPGDCSPYSRPPL